jgi:hypothetical protein
MLPQVLDKRSKDQSWTQNGHLTDHELNMDRLHDAVFMLSQQDPVLILAFDATASFMNEVPYANREKYTFLKPYSATPTVQTKGGEIIAL